MSKKKKSDLSEFYYSDLAKNLKDNNESINFYFHSDEYKNSISKLRETIKSLSEYKVDFLQDNALPKSTTISRKSAIRNINAAYKDEKLVLVLGAGISLEFGVPSWELLLQNLMVQIPD